MGLPFSALQKDGKIYVGDGRFLVNLKTRKPMSYKELKTLEKNYDYMTEKELDEYCKKQNKKSDKKK